MALIGQAARTGSGDCETIYGGMFATGAGVTKDLAKAAEPYRRAAEGGNGYGQLNLGYAYANGWGVVEDDQTSRRWFQSASGNGVAEARDALRTMP